MYLDSVFLEEKGFKEYFMWCGILFEKKVSFSPKVTDQKSLVSYQKIKKMIANALGAVKQQISI